MVEYGLHTDRFFDCLEINLSGVNYFFCLTTIISPAGSS